MRKDVSEWVVLILIEHGPLAGRQAALLDLRNVTVLLSHRPECAAAARPHLVHLIAEDCTDEFFVRGLRAVRHAHLDTCTIIRTAKNIANAVALGRALGVRWAGQILWLEASPSDVKVLSLELLERDLSRQVEDLFRSAMACDDRLVCRAIEYVFRSGGKPRDHGDLASELGVSGRVLRMHWREAGFQSRSEALLDWALLAAAIEGRGRGRSLAQAARDLRVSPDRLQRAAYRRIGRAAGGLDRSDLLNAARHWIGGNCDFLSGETEGSTSAAPEEGGLA
jgi:hypothetical protein